VSPSAAATELRSVNGKPTTEVADRLAELRKLAETYPASAQTLAWTWIQELGDRRAASQLNELFRLGTAPQGLDGPTDGILVAPMIAPVLDSVLGGLTRFWMPWMGKSFDSASARGYNRMTPSSRWVSKVLWPLYGMKPDEGGRAAFDFETAVEPGKADPDVQVLKIDYEPIDENPGLVIRQIRDELVELVPDTYLGKILYHRGDEYPCIGYFALRQPASS
jgi:hypothetical protein